MSKNQITSTIRITANDLALISTYYNNNSDNWSNKNLDPIKVRLKKKLIKEQENKCCYCKRFLSSDKNEIDIEHIVSKAKYVAYSFLPKNLALSCKSCNTKKGQKVVVNVGVRLNIYPLNKTDYKIVHPHFHEYYSEVDILEGIIFKEITTEGANLIKMCGLATLQKSMAKAEDKIFNKSTFNKISRNLIKISEKKKYKGEKAFIKKVIKDIEKNKARLLDR